jgi:hypothetical protein
LFFLALSTFMWIPSTIEFPTFITYLFTNIRRFYFCRTKNSRRHSAVYCPQQKTMLMSNVNNPIGWNEIKEFVQQYYATTITWTRLNQWTQYIRTWCIYVFKYIEFTGYWFMKYTTT